MLEMLLSTWDSWVMPWSCHKWKGELQAPVQAAAVLLGVRKTPAVGSDWKKEAADTSGKEISLKGVSLRDRGWGAQSLQGWTEPVEVVWVSDQGASWTPCWDISWDILSMFYYEDAPGHTQESVKGVPSLDCLLVRLLH